MSDRSYRRAAVLCAGLLCTAGGAAAGELPRAVRVLEDAIQPQVAVGPGGRMHIVSIHRGNIAVSTSTDRGRTFSGPVTAIDAGGRAAGGAQRGPRIGIDEKGRIHVTCPVVFDEAELSKQYPTADLYLVSSVDGGATWSRPRRINEVEKKAPEALHWMAVAPSGEVHVSWLDRREKKKGEDGQDLFYTRVSGEDPARNTMVVTDVCECCAPGLAVARGGDVLVAYREGGKKPSREIWLARRRAKEERFGEPSRLNREPSLLRTCPMSAPAVAVSPDGQVVAAAWMDQASGESDVRWSVARKGVFGPVKTLGDDASGRQDHPALTFDEDQVLWAAWEDGARGKSRILFATAGEESPKSREGSSRAEGAAAFPALASGNGLVVLVYETSKDGDEGVTCRVIRDGT